MVDLDGQAQLQRYLDAREAYSNALAKAAILKTGQPIVTKEWRAFYSAELGRLETEEVEAGRKWLRWLKANEREDVTTSRGRREKVYRDSGGSAGREHQ